MLEHADYIAFITAVLGAFAGYLAKTSKEKLAFERATQISEKELMRKIDNLQNKIIDLTRENAELRAEVANLREEIRNGRKLAFRGEDYSAGE